MDEKMRWSAAVRWLEREWETVRRSVHCAFEQAGPERDTLVQSLKAAMAAIAAWALTGWWLQAPMALLAPWTAVALVGGTVYQSLRMGLQQCAVIAVGTVWASAAMAVTRDQTMAAMLLTVPFMTLLGNYRRFGNQGLVGATTALFVITAGSSSAFTVGHRLLETLIGAAVGITVNALVLPPVHLRSVRDRLGRFARGTSDLLGAMARGLREEDGLDGARSWDAEATRLALSLQGVADARAWALEGARLNPAMRLRRTGPPPPPVSEDMRWGRVSSRVLAVTRTLSGIGGGDADLPGPSPRFLADLADVLDQAARVCARKGMPPPFDGSAPEREDPVVEEAWASLRALSDAFSLQEGAAAAVGGELLVEARQLLHELARPS
ncbi:hypothetical protein [Streptomyces sp. NPDC008125]|uniref:FUSC family protein n=1 Tax=Streptomyces sp. NPDC008125 TaxID=3364811 RepID=UPI0036EF26F1